MTEKNTFAKWDSGDLCDLAENHMDLCIFLHKHWAELPPKLAEELEGMVYLHYEP